MNHVKKLTNLEEDIFETLGNIEFFGLSATKLDVLLAKTESLTQAIKEIKAELKIKQKPPITKPQPDIQTNTYHLIKQ